MKKPDCFSRYKYFLQQNCYTCRLADKCKHESLLKKDDVFKILDKWNSKDLS